VINAKPPKSQSRRATRNEGEEIEENEEERKPRGFKQKAKIKLSKLKRSLSRMSDSISRKARNFSIRSKKSPSHRASEYGDGDTTTKPPVIE